ncbi:putative oxidoreductase [Mariniradius saccharolyticus AK6]|uniref:Oxidoreductase n=1 Tax=Mariniradius saccharolyticus AK6 TaxID=1239962 RepID=M7YCB8_9BACT|nr:Gfo/Idh/MocA family oxidoreductase [Mariniradius saccharolyticus]EMS34806.1 putative oxidoreductase [Mariniradius saccharolyticus AK6]
MEKYRTGIIGCGKVAQLHAKALLGAHRSDFTAVYSRSLAKAKGFGEAYGAKGYDSITEMVQKEKLDLVMVCTPHPNHKDPTLEALAAGANVIVEKPLASSLADCDAMIAAAKKYSKKLGVISQRRFYEPVQRVREAIDAGKIGKPILGTAAMLSWRDEKYYASDPWRGTWQHEGGGVLVNQAPHQLDLLCWLMGDIAEVYGTWANLNHPYIEVEDTALAIVKFKSGALGNIVLSNSQKPGIHGKVHIHGSNGASVGVEPESGAMFIAGISGISKPPFNDLWTIPGEENLPQEWMAADTRHFEKIDATYFYIQRQIEEFLESLDAGREPLVTGLDGRKVVELFTAIYRSKERNGPVSFPIVG